MPPPLKSSTNKKKSMSQMNCKNDSKLVSTRNVAILPCKIKSDVGSNCVNDIKNKKVKNKNFCFMKTNKPTHSKWLRFVFGSSRGLENVLRRLLLFIWRDWLDWFVWLIVANDEESEGEFFIRGPFLSLYLCRFLLLFFRRSFRSIKQSKYQFPLVLESKIHFLF